jgi:TIR domain
MSEVFLSYSRRSQKHAVDLMRELMALGVSFSAASNKTGAGDEGEIFKEIKDARVVAFLITPHSLVDQEYEYMAALEHSWSDEDKVLVPVLVGNSEPPSFLRHASVLRVKGQKSDWPRVAKTIGKILSEGNSVKRSKAPMREQTERLNLIEKEANALRSRS